MPRFWNLCRNGMEDMQYIFINYNFIAFFERKLPFFCKRTKIMSIMKNITANFHCAEIQSRVRHTTEPALFLSH